MVYLLALLALPYACFVFFSENFNPFARPKNPLMRKQWRTGRAMGVSMLLGMAITLGLFLTTLESATVSVIVGLAITLAFAAVFSTRKISEYLFG